MRTQSTSMCRDYLGNCDTEDVTEYDDCNIADCPPNCVFNNESYYEGDVTRDCVCEIWWV